VDPLPGKVIAYGRRTAVRLRSSKLLYTAEGINSSVAITRWADGNLEVDVNGHVEATTEPYDMKLQRMVGHLPALIHAIPRPFWESASAPEFPPERSRAIPASKNHRVRDRAGDSAHLHDATSPSRITTCCTTRAPTSSSTTPATTC
jgi:hypothetical protein